MILFHGSQKVIKKPVYGYGNKYNDYGLGLYMTEHIELAKEWSAAKKSDGFVSCYDLDFTDLSVLYLTRGDYHILNWLAILLENRLFRLNSDIANQAKTYILDNYLPDYNHYDVICGYRADDSYFSFANLFLNNGISLSQLQKVMHLGNLGEQVVLKSKKSFEKLSFVDYERTDHIIYYPKKMSRDTSAREAFRREKASIYDGIYMMDILREGWMNDDERLQRIISG